MRCAPILRYHGIVKQCVTNMYHRGGAFMEQIKPRFTPSGPPILQLLKRKPLEQTVFMQELRYPPIHVQVTAPSVIWRIQWFGKGHHHPKDMENVHDDGDTESFPAGFSIVLTLRPPGRQPGSHPTSAELHPLHLGGHGGALLSLGQGHLPWARCGHCCQGAHLGPSLAVGVRPASNSRVTGTCKAPPCLEVWLLVRLLVGDLVP